MTDEQRHSAERTSAGFELRRLALVVPEFLVDGTRSGGLDSVAEFVIEAFSADAGWSVDVLSPRMSSVAPESRRLLRPADWGRSPRSRSVSGEFDTTYYGAALAEIEVMRYAPRRAMTRRLDGYDAVVVVAGSPALMTLVSQTSTPVVAQVATMVADERAELLARLRGLARLRVGLMTRLVSLLDDRGLRIPRVVLVENARMLALCTAMGARTELVPPGVDCDLFSPAARGDKGDYILAVGRWEDPRKNLGVLLRAYERARTVGGIAQRLVLAGPHEPTRDDLRLIRSLGLDDFVDVRVNLPTAELATLYRRAQLFVLTSTEEGLGLVFVEAMASGTPVVATATAGARQVMGGSGAGELVELGDGLVERFAQVLVAWCWDQELLERAGSAGRRNAVERFDRRSAGARYRAVVEGCLPGPASGRNDGGMRS